MRTATPTTRSWRHLIARTGLMALAATALLMAAAMPASAEPITREQARQRAAEFLSTRHGSRQLKAVETDTRLSPRRHVRKVKGLATDALDLYYVFDRGQEEGFVIVSGDDQTVPVLGYTDQGHFDYTQLPPNMQFWLQGYENELDAIRAGVPPVGANIPTHDPVAELCTSKWNQTDPYNQSCPMYFNLGRSVTGCVATAMAQILYYHRAKMVTETQAQIPAYQAWAEKPYNGQYLQVEAVPAESPIDWDNMLDTYSSSATAKQKKAVADLMWYCGASVEMGYTNSSSGANSFKVANALPQYFGFGESVKYHYFEGESFTETQWDAMIYNEIANSRPVYLSGANSSGGHAFVCDGYDGNLCYHINWGWGGGGPDGYYLLASLLPGSQGIGGSDGGYSQQRECVIGIEPINFGTRALPFQMANLKRICTDAFDTDGDGILTYGEAAAVTDLGDVFKGTTITSFTELYNFTNLTTIPDDAFNGCARLTAIKLPKSIKKIGARAFYGCSKLKEISLRDDIKEIGAQAFYGCRVMPNTVLPASLTTIADATFEGCAAMTAVTLPLGIQHIGSRAFADCTKLNSFAVKSINPQNITLGDDVWAGIDLSAATLNGIQGSQEYFASAPQWRDFGNIYQQRTLAGGNFVTIETNKTYYIYNVGTGRYLTRGEAWGTQAIVANTDEPMRFELRRTATMPEGVYYLYSIDTGNTNHVLFRTSTDGNVGQGVKACFVDGATSHVTDKSAYWAIRLVEGSSNVYTMQTPTGVSGYDANQFLGVQTSHASNAASPTYGTYSDISYADYSSNCQWMFTPYDEAQKTNFQRASQLENLLNIAKKKKLDTTNEDAVYNNLSSTSDDIGRACARLRKRLGFIAFKDDAVRRVCVENIDADSDGEISYTEAANVNTIGGIFSGNTAIVDLADLEYFTKLEYLAGNEFKSCTALQNAVLPENLTGVYYRAFLSCNKLKSVSLPFNLKNIGDDAFNGCSSLTEVRVAVADPANISLGSNIFRGVAVKDATLYVPYGSRELYAQADVWKEFGTIKEMRAMRWPDYAELEANKDFYVYNLGQQAYINKGEAWGTQAVVATTGLVYQLKRTNAMPEGTYYLQATLTGNNILFRTDTDSKVGAGIKTCFVDGTVSAKAYWTIKETGSHIYSLQTPSNQADYVAADYLGTDYSHATNAVNGTYGLYWDIKSPATNAGAQWAFISVDEVNAARQAFERSEELKRLLAQANNQSINVAPEQAVYDDFQATDQQIEGAITSVRAKLHYIDFVDERVLTITRDRWDINDDDEISTEELAAATDIASLFKGNTAIKSLEDLKYFTALRQIPAEAFRGNSNTTTLVLPAGVTTIGSNALYGTSRLKYLAITNTDKVVDGSESGLSVKSLTLFVPAALVEAYRADAFWGKYNVVEYTGTPVVAAQPASREYGRANSAFEFSVAGAPISGEPELSTEAVLTTPVGDFPIVVGIGSIVTNGVQLQNGTLTIRRAPVTVTAQSYTRAYGEPNPEFEVKYSVLRNREKIEDVLTAQPVIECDATPESYAGDYEIRVSGCQADNYEFTYVDGKLTIEGGPDAIEGVKNGETTDNEAYDLAGRKLQRSTRNTQNSRIIIRGGKKIAVAK